MKLFAVITSAAMLAALAGCVTAQSFETGREHPSLEIVGSGVKFQGEYVMPDEVPKLLEECGVPHDAVVHIRISQFDRLREAQAFRGRDKARIGRDAAEFDRLMEAQAFRGLLARAGYTRTALVTKEHGESWSQTQSGMTTGGASLPRR